MADIADTLRQDFVDEEAARYYAESFLNTSIATQIKVLREQRGMNQAQLADAIGTQQTNISRIENVNYSSWTLATLKKVAAALDVRLRVSFETFGSLINEVDAFSRESLQRVKHSEDQQIAKPFRTWHEDDHDVLWWRFPIQEPPYVGSPLCVDWPFEEEDEPNLGWTRFITPEAKAK